jgi:Tol biopolymer transport system component
MRRLTLVLAALAAGCFPVLVDVDRNGRALIPRQEGVFAVDLKSGGKAELITKPIKGLPTWARWSPDGERVLVAEILKDRHQSALFVIDLSSKSAKPLGAFADAACALWSPKSDYVSVTERGKKGLALVVVKLATGEKKTLLEDVVPAHDWLPDGKLVAFRCGSQVQDSMAHSGEVMVVDPATGQTTSIASAACDHQTVLDADPAGKRVLIVQTGDQGQRKLSVVSLPEGEKKTLVTEGVIAGFWSPDGQRVAVLQSADRERARRGVAPGGGRIILSDYVRSAQLAVCDGEGRDLRVIAPDVALGEEQFYDIPFLPSWADGATVLYFQRINVYGDAGAALHLMSVRYTGLGREDMQVGIERKLADLSK